MTNIISKDGGEALILVELGTVVTVNVPPITVTTGVTVTVSVIEARIVTIISDILVPII